MAMTAGVSLLLAAVLLLLCGMTATATTTTITDTVAPAYKSDSLPSIHASGSLHDIGVAIGVAFGSHITASYAASSGFQRVKAWVASSAEGAAAVAALEKNVQNSPMSMYLDELQGVAAGSGVAYADLLMFNMLDELEPLYNNATHSAVRVEHCSDMLTHKPDGSLVHGHNEDGGHEFLGRNYLSMVRAPDANYTAYHYPGQLASGAFAFNSHGVYFSTNAIFPKPISLDGVPRCFLHRYILAATSLEEALHRATSTRLASGFSLNLGSMSEQVLYNVELSSQGSNVLQVQPGGYYEHFNMYKRLATPQYTSLSTLARQARFDELPPPRDVASILNILGDTENSKYPLYRNGAPPDTGVNTLTTVVFQSKPPSMAVYMNNPKLYPTPLMTLPVPAPAVA